MPCPNPAHPRSAYANFFTGVDILRDFDLGLEAGELTQEALSG